MNTMKTFLLMAGLTLLVIYAGNAFGGEQGMIIAFAFAVVMNFGTYWFSDKIVLKMYRARELQASDNPALFRLTEDLTARAGLPMPKLYVIDEPQPNAFATGRNPANAAVAVTSGILKLLSHEELQGVIAHELSHIKNRDILIGTVAATAAGAITMLAHMAKWAMIFGGRGVNDRNGGNSIAAIATMILAPIAAMLIQLAISRSREFAADETAATLIGNPMGLANALRKLNAKAEQIPLEASPATAHMFIVNPLSGGGIAKLFSTHPPAAERISRLEAMVYGG
jgi:heat shock protein HtpX